ncbi:NAD-dependent protein deacylase [Clostridium cochlearium]|uniref:NAD-dependent protein deacetylase n=1 Tax=Clostridium cochlearium TaxID=1494 RepID=A0ABY0QNM4_CLOCO|nr:NAD-dependent protein deacylase [Clostridium cochlearium]MBV1817127.1 NAD-dependent protein deacylase [Bacteroidales bacterium MSK.15.36]NSJ92464.1 NAD-dependent protein deacylase [Coprococcus sp. MSK.21.13]MCG4572876.1 NAD-dependent protein deacylase [Clostridium cochlearium]MCG4580295.1 NAD-dependent protein deacylase [Clostridium cochlearium]MCR1972504.1 NAD-dependent protein deacylase [Clostridium cochlearium]
MDNTEKLKDLIKSSSNIVFFGGAGVSTESNIPDFRSEQGLYKTKNSFSYPPEVMLSHSFFIKHTEDFFNFYREKMIYKNAKPNSAHYALAKLEQVGKLKAVITQNIDGLHQLAGSKNVIELHGGIGKNYCMNCNKAFDLNYILNSKEVIPKCDICGGIVKPDVVLYEEPLNMDNINNAIRYVEESDVLIIGGTSLIVYPAANLIHYYKGNKLVLINKSSTPYDTKAQIVIHDKIGAVLGNIVKELEY